MALYPASGIIDKYNVLGMYSDSLYLVTSIEAPHTKMVMKLVVLDFPGAVVPHSYCIANAYSFEVKAIETLSKAGVTVPYLGAKLIKHEGKTMGAIFVEVLDGTYRSLLKSVTSSEKEGLEEQITKKIDIMHKEGYAHGDLHLDNIAYKRTSHGIELYIIDTEELHLIVVSEYQIMSHRRKENELYKDKDIKWLDHNKRWL